MIQTRQWITIGIIGAVLLLTRQSAAQRLGLAQAAAAALVNATGKPAQYESWFEEIAAEVKGYHPTYLWHTKDGITFCVIPFGGGGTRLTYDFASAPFCEANRNCQHVVEFRLLNVAPAYQAAVWWTVQSDRTGAADANRQADQSHKTRHGDAIVLTEPQKGDSGFYLAGRWDQSIGKKEFCKANPEGGVLLVLK